MICSRYSPQEYKVAERELEEFRERCNAVSRPVKTRLYSIPFWRVHVNDLFNTIGYPCLTVSRQLVYKIVDELLWCGAKGGERDAKRKKILG